MPIRKVPLVTNEYYHVFNHGVDYREICSNDREYKRLLLTLWFYQPTQSQFKLSKYLVLPKESQQSLITEVNTKTKLVEIHAFSLLPNHFHLLLKQLVDNGISIFIGNVQNSFSKYYNSKYERRGSLFLNPFRSKHIQTEEQYLHVSRYIHLNRYSCGIMKNIYQLPLDPCSSLPYYLHSLSPQRNLVHTASLANMFSSTEKHWEFIQDQADYQRQLEHIKHLIDE